MERKTTKIEIFKDSPEDFWVGHGWPLPLHSPRECGLNRAERLLPFYPLASADLAEMAMASLP